MSSEVDTGLDFGGSHEGVGVFVLGMHRSGTSAVTRVINLLGVPLSSPEDVMLEGSGGNPLGHWESDSLTAINDQLLHTLGGYWDAPPVLADGWSTSVPASFVRKAIDAFRAVYATRTWAWKDPRNCITLPFWMSILPVHRVFVVMIRDPSEIAESLARRDGFSPILGLALWERYVRDLLENLVGQRVLFLPFDMLVDETDAACSELTGFLQGSGIDADATQRGLITSFLDASMLSRLPGDAAFRPAEIGALGEVLSSLRGVHERLVPTPLPAPTSWGTHVLADHRLDRHAIHDLRRALGDVEERLEIASSRMLAAEREIESLRGSKSYRYTAPLRAVGDLLRRSRHVSAP